MRERLLVTGGAGFIGSEFVRQAVSRGFDVVVVDKLTYAGDLERLSDVNGRYRFYKIDTASIEEVQKVFDSENPDIVVHFAAESHVDRSLLEPYAFIDSNIKGTLNLLEASKVRNVKLFINVSTDEVYGDLGETGYFDEESPLRPNSPYSVSKAAQDMLGRAYFRSFGLPVITVRPSNNYGPWQYPEKLIPVVIYRALKGLPIPVYGKGENVREWLFVSDCVEGIFQAIEGGKPGEIYNIGSGEERQNIEVVKTICKMLDELVPKGTPHESLITFVKDRPGHDFRYGLDSTKAQRELGFKAKTPFEEGIRITVKWYLKHQDWLENKVLQLKDFWAKNYGNI